MGADLELEQNFSQMGYKYLGKCKERLVCLHFYLLRHC